MLHLRISFFNIRIWLNTESLWRNTTNNCVVCAIASSVLSSNTCFPFRLGKLRKTPHVKCYFNLSLKIKANTNDHPKNNAAWQTERPASVLWLGTNQTSPPKSCVAEGMPRACVLATVWHYIFKRSTFDTKSRIRLLQLHTLSRGLTSFAPATPLSWSSLSPKACNQKTQLSP